MGHIALACLTLLIAADPTPARAADAPGPLVPAKTYFAPDQPLAVTNTADRTVRLAMTDFVGRVVEAVDPAGAESAGRPGIAAGLTRVAAGQTVDLRAMFNAVRRPGTYVLFATPDDPLSVPARDFLGTPLVVGVRADRRPGAPGDPMVYAVRPLEYAVMETDRGPITIAFYDDVAPTTAEAFRRLAAGGYYDGLTFHRVVPGAIVQGGDPTGTGTGGAGFNLDAEFSDRRHAPGTISMARQVDPVERQGALPRAEAADSAGGQFFLALADLPALDRRYTVFGRATAGLEAVRAIGSVPLADRESGRPAEPPVIRSVEVRPVTADANPYARLFAVEATVESVTDDVTEGVGPAGVSGVPTPGSPATRAATRPAGTPLPGDPPPGGE